MGQTEEGGEQVRQKGGREKGRKEGPSQNAEVSAHLSGLSGERRHFYFQESHLENEGC